MFKDFLGQKIAVGDYLAYPGAGNRKAEYGLLLLKVKKLNPNLSITAERLDPVSGKIIRKNTNITSLTKVVKIQPSAAMCHIFENAENHYETVSKWVHGKFAIDWENIDLKTI